MRILLAEDDPLLGDGLRAGLRQHGFQVDWVRDGEAAERELRAEPYAAAVLDLGLPRRDGPSVLSTLRGAGNPVPVLVLTARDQVADKVRCLDLGADVDRDLGRREQPAALAVELEHAAGGERDDREVGLAGHQEHALLELVDLAVDGAVGLGEDEDRDALGGAVAGGGGDLTVAVGAAGLDGDAVGEAHDGAVEGDLELPGVHQAAEGVRDGGAGGVGVHQVDVVLAEDAAALGVEVGVVDDLELAERELEAGGHAGAADVVVGLARGDEQGDAGPGDGDGAHPREGDAPEGDGVGGLRDLGGQLLQLVQHVGQVLTSMAPGMTSRRVGFSFIISPSIMTSTSPPRRKSTAGAW